MSPSTRGAFWEWALLDSFAGLVARDGAQLVGVTYGWFGRAESRGTPLPGADAARRFHVGDLIV